MNIKFNGEIDIHHVKGKCSEAAKQAFKDILSDQEMKVDIVIGEAHIELNMILSEEKVLTEQMESLDQSEIIDEFYSGKTE